MITPSFSLTATERVLPKLALDFTTANLDSRVTFTRSGNTATRVNSSGYIEVVNANTPRFDYSPVSLLCNGLLIEESRTNVLTYSNTFSNAAWSKLLLTVGASSETSPGGTADASLLTGTTGGGGYLYVTSPYATSAVGHSASIYLKKGTGTSAILYFVTAGNGNGGSCNFDLNTGVASTPVNYGSVTNTTATMTPAGNGWYRCSISLTATAGNYFFQLQTTGTITLSSWGSQLEVGAFPTSYIPTVASQVTRSADIATMTGANFSSWYNASAGTFRATYGASPNTFTTYLVASNGVTAQNSFHFDNDSGNMRAVYYSGSSAVATLGLGARGTVGTVNSVASAYSVNNFTAARNAGTVVTDTAGAVPASLTQLNIGADPSGAAVNVMNTRIQKIFYYPLALTNAEVQAFSKG
jgi:hypothetical protein